MNLSLPVTVLDVETTGVTPTRNRIVEVALLRYSTSGELVREFASVVNPERDVGPSEVHGLWASDVARAPRFAGLADELFELMESSVVVGHNVAFDLRFLRAEAARLGLTFPEVPHVCTLALGRQRIRDLVRWRLVDCCEALGIALEKAHSALDDARATARLFWRLDAELPVPMPGGAVDPLPRSGYARVAPLSRPAARQGVEAADSTPIRRLLSRLALPPDIDAGTAAYLAVLERALEDRQITSSETEELYAVARECGLSAAAARAAHEQLLCSFVAAALSDAAITASEHTDLAKVANLLDIPASRLQEVIEEETRARAGAAREGARSVGSTLTGKSVCFTGSLVGSLNGTRLTRDVATDLVKAAGLTVAERVTRSLDILVVADPATQSGKARLAREYGVRVLAESELWRLLGVAVG